MKEAVTRAAVTDESRGERLVFPLLPGGGKRLFADGRSLRHLTLTATRPTLSGVLIDTYRRPEE